MADSLNKQRIDGLISRARTVKGKQFELVDERVAGLRIRAGERSATWLLCVRLRNGKRTRIKLGGWPAMGISEARHAAQAKKLEVVSGGDPNEEKRKATKDAAIAAKGRRRLADVIDQYDRTKLSQLRSAAETRRALDGRSGILKAFVNKDIASIERNDIADAVRARAQKAPIAANRSLAYVKAFLNWCVDQDIIENNPAATIKKPTKERTRDRYAQTGAKPENDQDKEEWYKARSLMHLEIHRRLVVSGQIEPARQTVMAHFPIEQHHFLPIVCNSPFVENGYQMTFSLGFARLWQGDFVSAANLLIPQLENAIRYVLKNSNAHSAKMMSDLTQDDRSLSSLFDHMRLEMENIFGVDLIREIDLLFNYRPGPALRHQAAHGKMTDGQCYSPDAIYACWLIYHMTCLPLIGHWKGLIGPEIETQSF